MKEISELYCYKNYLFDLDNTIIDEKQYLFAVYYKIAKDFSLDKDEFINLFINEGRNKLFNKIIEKYKLPNLYLNDFLYTLRNIKLPNKLTIIPSMYELLKKLIILKKNIFLITNGNIAQQQNKLNQIDWQGIDASIQFILANVITPKPSLELFLHLKKEFSLNEQETIMIGDSQVDEEFAKNANISFQNAKGLY